MKELFKKLRKYEIQIRKAINRQMQGDFHSVFKGSGLEFDDFRPYQYGDDVRTIDWNVSAKGHGTFIKTFKETKEQTVFFLLDVSASQNIGAANQQKIHIGKEITGVLTLAALKEAGLVGLECFSDVPELYIKPGKGVPHGYRLIQQLFSLEPGSKKTDLNRILALAMQRLKRRSIVILISDFIDSDYDRNLKALAKKHDLVVIHLMDPREKDLPNLGIVPLKDQETGRTVWVNTSSSEFRKTIGNRYAHTQSHLEEMCRRYGANYLAVNTQEDYVPSLIRLFKVRNSSRRAG
ncbi:MAG: DUF58 domain-containing protein [Bacteroidota bacterium]